MEKIRLEEEMHFSYDIIETSKDERHWACLVCPEMKVILALNERELLELVYFCQEQ